MKKYYIGTALILILIILFYFLFSNENEKEELLQLRYASVKSIVEAPAHVAFQNRYFENEGLDLSMRINPDGKTSLDQLFLDSIDIASVMATPVVYKSFQRNDFYIFGVIEYSEKIHSCIARKDKGINSAKDLKGKTIGVLKESSGEFFMNSFLIVNELLPSDLNIINLNGPEMVDAINKNEIDAGFYWDSYLILAEKRLKNNAVRLSSPRLIPSSWVFVARNKFVNENPEAVKRFL